VRDVAEPIWYPLWDGGITLSPATHSVRSALALARDELVTATSLLGVRHLAGDRGLVDDLARRASANWQDRPLRWARRLREATLDRWQRWGEVSSLLEPNLKDGRGGLRDLDTLRWTVALDREFANALELAPPELARTASVLLAARVELHRITGRAGDVLLLQHQDEVAAALGVADAAPVAAAAVTPGAAAAVTPGAAAAVTPGVDAAGVLMRQIVDAARGVDWATERFWRRVDRLVDPPRWPGHRSRTLDHPPPGLVVVADEVQLTPAFDLDEPAAVFEVAAAAARSEIALGAELLGTLAADTVAEPAVPWSERTRRAFLALLGTGDAVVATVEALEHVGLFSRFVPEWSAVRSLPQRNAFHRYNVDRHLLQTVANAAVLLRRVGRPDLLLMAALLHDLGKGRERDHSELGVELTHRVMERAGFDPADVATVATVVRHHLLLAEVATRRDLSDPRTIAGVTAALGTVERLELLRALSEADGLATGPAAWSTWKRTLVDQLTRAAAAALHGRPGPPEAHRPPNAPSAMTVRANGGVIVERDGESEVVRLHVAAVPRPAWLATAVGVLSLHRFSVLAAEQCPIDDGVSVVRFDAAPPPGDPVDVDRLADDLVAAHAGGLDVGARLRSRAASRLPPRPVSASPARTQVTLSNDASDATTMIDVRAPDAPGLLYRLLEVLAEHDLEVSTAKIATLGHEVVDVFYVRRPDHPDRSGGPGGQVAVGEHEALRAALLASVGHQ